MPETLAVFRPTLLRVFYAVANVLALGWLAQQATTDRRDFVRLFVLLLCSPFFIFNSTQVMMETALLPAVSLTMATVLAAERNGLTWISGLALFVTGTTAVLIKGTAAPALAILLIGLFPRLRSQLWPLAMAIVLDWS